MHLMLDFETLGTSGDTIVLSLGAVCFNRDGIVGENLFEFDLFDQVQSKRSFTASTMEWWMTKADADARKVFEHNDFKLKIPEFFRGFEELCDQNLNKCQEKRDELKVWGNGANFDVVLIEDLYRRHHPRMEHAIPWKYWNVWCYRTFNNLTKCKDLIRLAGTKHNALDDARFQANTILAYWKQQDARKAAAAKGVQ